MFQHPWVAKDRRRGPPRRAPRQWGAPRCSCIRPATSPPPFRFPPALRGNAENTHLTGLYRMQRELPARSPGGNHVESLTKPEVCREVLGIQTPALAIRPYPEQVPRSGGDIQRVQVSIPESAVGGTIGRYQMGFKDSPRWRKNVNQGTGAAQVPPGRGDNVSCRI